MAERTISVEFLPVETMNEVTATPEVHDIGVPEGIVGAPQILENPHVDFPGTWQLTGEGEGGVYRYAKVAEVADTSDTVEL